MSATFSLNHDQLFFREIRESEFSFLKEMFYVSLFVRPGQEPFPKSIIEKPNLAKYTSDWAKGILDHCIVVDYNKQLIGAAWGRLLQGEVKGYGYVDDQTPEIGIAILPDYQKSGIGTTLMNHLFDAYSDKGVAKISLSVDKLNYAKDLYLKLGFEIISEDQDSMVMVKSL